MKVTEERVRKRRTEAISTVKPMLGSHISLLQLSKKSQENSSKKKGNRVHSLVGELSSYAAKGHTSRNSSTTSDYLFKRISHTQNFLKHLDLFVDCFKISSKNSYFYTCAK